MPIHVPLVPAAEGWADGRRVTGADLLVTGTSAWSAWRQQRLCGRSCPGLTGVARILIVLNNKIQESDTGVNAEGSEK